MTDDLSITLLSKRGEMAGAADLFAAALDAREREIARLRAALDEATKPPAFHLNPATVVVLQCVASMRRWADRSCVVCGTTFHPVREDIRCCSNKCAGIYRAEQYRADMPETTCECCKAVFRATRPFAKYCSKRCASLMSGRFFRQRQKEAKATSAPLTAAVFDTWFLMAA